MSSNPSYKVTQADIQTISFITRNEFAKHFVVEALVQGEGNYQDTLRYLVTGCEK